MTKALHRLPDIVLALAAVVIASVTVRREFFRGDRSSSRQNEYLENWSELVTAGLWIGPRTASVRIIEFGDLECPACRRFHTTLQEVRQEKRKDVALIFVHYPLAQHRFARPAAKGLECADAQGRAPAFLDLTYEKQDSLGLKTWESFATEAGLKSAAAFGKCITEPSHTERIEAGVALGHRVGVHGTPTIIINGWRLATAPRSSSELSAMISRVAEGGTPVKDYTRRRF